MGLSTEGPEQGIKLQDDDWVSMKTRAVAVEAEPRFRGFKS